MAIEGIGEARELGFIPISDNKKSADQTSFDNVLTSFIKQTQQESTQAEDMTEDFIMGKDVEVHEVMIAAEKAKTDVMLLAEIRNKALDTYNELIKMQI